MALCCARFQRIHPACGRTQLPAEGSQGKCRLHRWSGSFRCVLAASWWPGMRSRYRPRAAMFPRDCAGSNRIAPITVACFMAVLPCPLWPTWVPARGATPP